MSAAEAEEIVIEDSQAVIDAADCWADEYGTAEAIQRLWIAVGHLKKRQVEEEREAAQ